MITPRMVEMIPKRAVMRIPARDDDLSGAITFLLVFLEIGNEQAIVAAEFECKLRTKS